MKVTQIVSTYSIEDGKNKYRVTYDSDKKRIISFDKYQEHEPIGDLFGLNWSYLSYKPSEQLLKKVKKTIVTLDKYYKHKTI